MKIIVQGRRSTHFVAVELTKAEVETAIHIAVNHKCQQMMEHADFNALFGSGAKPTFEIHWDDVTDRGYMPDALRVDVKSDNES